MTEKMKDLSKMKVLIGNDDGINATGIKLLESIVKKYCDNIIAIAPISNRSGASQSLTLANSFTARKLDDNHYAIDGSPVDSIAFGLRHLFSHNDYPDLVLSGINSDANISDDILYSGTIGVAREACLFRIPSIAFSQQRGIDGSTNWEIAQHYTDIVLNQILDNYTFVDNVFLSVNFPAVEKISEVRGIRSTFQGRRIIKDRLVSYTDPRNMIHYWIGKGSYVNVDHINTIDSDIGAINEGYITITPIEIDNTSYEQLNTMRNTFNADFNDNM
ncbi:MAG: 5'/3'-nucleotidase SurE [Alphaproteobacteria bacterium]|nr:5'/3'-nucleotidase SurE [Alphaproteobacteria bacterium]